MVTLPLACRFRMAPMLILGGVIAAAPAFAQGAYYPPAGAWEKRAAAQVGLVQSSVDSAVKLAIAAESTTPRDLLENHLSSGRSRMARPWGRSAREAAPPGS